MKVLLATDGSDCSEDAARFLTRLDLKPQDEIDILHVISSIPFDDDYHAQIKRAIKRVAPKILEAAADILSPVKAQIGSIESEGMPDETILKTADVANADLIVVGARGIKGIKRMFLGSTTRAVAVKSTRPVLVFKRSGRDVRNSLKILYATDGSLSAQDTGRYLASLPFPRDTEITIVNIFWSAVSDIPERLLVEINDRMKAEAATVRAKEYRESEKVIEEAKTLFHGRFSKIHGMTKTGDPSLVLLETESSLQPDVIAVGSRGLRGIKGIMGSVSRRILEHAEGSVLIGKPLERR